MCFCGLEDKAMDYDYKSMIVEMVNKIDREDFLLKIYSFIKGLLK